MKYRFTFPKTDFHWLIVRKKGQYPTILKWKGIKGHYIVSS